MKWFVERRDVLILALLAVTSICLCALSLGFLYQAQERTKVANQVIWRADSLVKDWTKRGCAPRTSTVP